MASFNPLDVLLQKVFVLATGTAASRVELNNLAGLLGPSGNDYASLIRAIDGHMASYAVQYGVITAVQDVIANGTGQRIDTSEAKKLINDFISPDGKSGWGNLFANYVLSTSDNGKALQNRAEAAQEFIELIATANKNELLNGAAIHQAVKTQIDSIDKNVSTLNQAKEALGLIATHLNSSGLYVKAIDGYLSGATTFVDFDRDKFQDNGEWFTKTDSGGNLNLSKMAMGKNMIATGGTDIMTGQAFLGTLSAPVGSTVITPLTTLVDALVDKGHSVASAKSLVQTGLAVPFVNLLTYDPLPVLADSLSTPSSKATALQVQSISQQVAGVLTNAMVMLTKEGKPKASAFDAIVSSVADELASSPAVKLDDAKTVKTIFQNAANKIGSSDLFAQAEKLAGVVADVNGKAAAATTVLDLGKLHVIAQYDLPKAINTTASFDPTGFSGTGLTTKIGAATPKDVLPGVPFGSSTTSPTPPTTSTTPPVLLDMYVSSDGKKIILNYDQTLSPISANKSNFSVSVNSASNTVDTVSSSGKTVELGLANTIADTDIVRLSYIAPTVDNTLSNQAIQNGVGIDAASINAPTLVKNSSTVPAANNKPVLSSIETDVTGQSIIIKYNKDLAAGATQLPDPSAFELFVDGVKTSVSSVSPYDSSSLEIKLTTAVKISNDLKLSYKNISVDNTLRNKAIQDTLGNDASGFTQEAVTNKAADPKVTITAADYDKTTNTLTLDGTLLYDLLSKTEASSTSIINRLDWSKIVWDINSDLASTRDVYFSSGDINSAVINNGKIVITLANAKASALEAETEFALEGSKKDDSIIISSGFTKNWLGNPSSTDAANLKITFDAAPIITSTQLENYDGKYHFTIGFDKSISLVDSKKAGLFVSFINGTSTNNLTAIGGAIYTDSSGKLHIEIPELAVGSDKKVILQISDNLVQDTNGKQNKLDNINRDLSSITPPSPEKNSPITVDLATKKVFIKFDEAITPAKDLSDLKLKIMFSKDKGAGFKEPLSAKDNIYIDNTENLVIVFDEIPSYIKNDIYFQIEKGALQDTEGNTSLLIESRKYPTLIKDSSTTTGNLTHIGTNGPDTLIGGSGDDILTGNDGNDVFVFDYKPLNNSSDTITDFNVGEDKIHISKTAFDKLKSLGSLSSAEFLSLSVAGEKNATTKDNRLIYNTADGNLYYDADGSELAANPILIGTFTGTPSLSVSDFVIIA